MTAPSELLRQRRLDREAIALLRQNSSPRFYDEFRNKHADNTLAGIQLKSVLSEAIKHAEESGDPTQVRQSIHALGWSDENRYQYFVKAKTAHEREALHNQLSDKGAFQNISNLVGSPAGMASVSFAMAKAHEMGFEKFTDFTQHCITNALVQGNTILSNPAFHAFGTHYAVAGVAFLTLGTLAFGNKVVEAYEKAEKYAPVIAKTLTELSNKGLAIADTPTWLKDASRMDSMGDNPLTHAGQAEFVSLTSSDKFKSMQTDDERQQAVHAVKRADQERVAKTFQDIPFASKAMSQSLGYGKMVYIADALNGQSAEFAIKSKSEVAATKGAIVRTVSFDTSEAGAFKSAGVAALGMAENAAHAIGDVALPVIHSVEECFHRMKASLAKLTHDPVAVDASAGPARRKAPTG